MLIFGALSGRAQIYGHWVNRLPLQCVNSDTAQVWQYDCDSSRPSEIIGMPGTGIIVPSTTFHDSLWYVGSSQVMLKPHLGATGVFHSYRETSRSPREIMIPVVDSYVISSGIVHGDAEFEHHTLEIWGKPETKYDMLVPRGGSGAYIHNTRNGNMIWFKSEILAVHFFKQIRYLK